MFNESYDRKSAYYAVLEALKKHKAKQIQVPKQEGLNSLETVHYLVS